MAKSRSTKPSDTESSDPVQVESKISKSEAARRAIAAGVEQPTEASAYIKSQFHLDMTPQHFSAVKSQMKAKLGKVLIKPRSETRGGVSTSRGTRGSGSFDDTDLLAAIEVMKPLVAAFGVDKVKRLADLLG